MRLPDTNVLLYAVNADAPQHASARLWMLSALAAPAGVGMAWVALLGFVRIATRPGIFARPLSAGDAMQTVRHWLGLPRVRILHPGERHAPVLEDLLSALGSAGNLTTDAHLAALCIEHGATLASFDRDFLRFEGLEFELLKP